MGSYSLMWSVPRWGQIPHGMEEDFLEEASLSWL